MADEPLKRHPTPARTSLGLMARSAPVKRITKATVEAVMLQLPCIDRLHCCNPQLQPHLRYRHTSGLPHTFAGSLTFPVSSHDQTLEWQRVSTYAYQNPLSVPWQLRVPAWSVQWLPRLGTPSISNQLSQRSCRTRARTAYGQVGWLGVYQITLAFISLCNVLGWTVLTGVGNVGAGTAGGEPPG